MMTIPTTNEERIDALLGHYDAIDPATGARLIRSGGRRKAGRPARWFVLFRDKREGLTIAADTLAEACAEADRRIAKRGTYRGRPRDPQEDAMPTDATQVNIWLDDTLADFLDARSDGRSGGGRGKRGGRSFAAYAALARYAALLDRELRAVQLTEAEALLIADAGNGTAWDAQSARLLWAEIADALDDGLAAKWGVDGEALVAKLRALSAGQSLAVVDAIERAWRHPDAGEDWGAALRAVGLVR